MKTTQKDRFWTAVRFLNRDAEQNDRKDLLLNKQEAMKLYEKEVSPYGYPTWQSIVTKKAMTMFCTNKEVRENNLKHEDGSKIQLKTIAKSALNTPVHYITDDLANSLVETKPPSSVEILDKNILPEISVVFSKKFDSFNTFTIIQKENGIHVQLTYTLGTGNIGSIDKHGRDTNGELKGMDVPMEFFIPFGDPECCMYCDTKEYFIKNMLHQNYYTLKFGCHIDPKVWTLSVKQKFGNQITRSNSNRDMEYVQTVLEHDNLDALVNSFGSEVLNKAYRFCINLICLMTHQPEIVTVQKASKYVAVESKGFATTKVNNVPNVHWLGEDFVTRVQYSSKVDTDLSDISRGKPKKSHWRRGHWHTILQGPGRLQKRMKWFQPVFIKGNKQSTLAEEN